MKTETPAPIAPVEITVWHYVRALATLAVAVGVLVVGAALLLRSAGALLG